MKVGTVAYATLGASMHLLLKEFKDIFAFEVEEMPGVSLDLAVHKLAVDPKRSPSSKRKETMARKEVRRQLPKSKSC